MSVTTAKPATQTTHDEALAHAMIEKFNARPEMLIQILHLFVEQFGFISDLAIRQIAKEINISRADVHGVVSFYHDFKRTPSGKHVVKICQAESCQAMGSRALTAHAEKTLGIDLHATSGDNLLTLEPIYCLGNCALSPSVMIDDKVHGRVTPERFDALIKGAKA